MIEPWGLLVLDKPQGLTSHRAVQRVARALGVRRAGHAGTLDPMATGVLLVAVGRATRLVEYLVGHDKTYTARVRLGELRDTLDRDGEVVATRVVPPLRREDVEAVLERFLGTSEQIPPAFAAIKQGGEPLHRKARRGERVEAPARRITIHRLTLLGFEPPDLELEVECSKGTYVRALARDVGEALGTAATLWALRRTRSGPFSVEGAVTLEALEAAGPGASARLVGPAEMLRELPQQTVGKDGAALLREGRPVEARGEVDGPVAVLDEAGAVVAVAVQQGNHLRPRKVFPPQS